MIEQADPNSYVYKALENVIPVSTTTLYLKGEPSSLTLTFLSCLSLETSHLAIAAEFLWRPNERHMEEHTDAVHILPACE